MNKVIIITREGKSITLEEWQRVYGLTVGSTQIAKYFSIEERRFALDIREFGKLVVNELLIRVMDGLREALDHSVNVNSFNRTQLKQRELKAKGFRTATFSPHVALMAVDLDTPNIEDLRKINPKLSERELWEIAVKINREWVMMLNQVASILRIKVRIGSIKYLKEKQTFIHLDVCPEFYAKGKVFNKQSHPVEWESELRW